ncbi:MAG: hypothetical protein QOI95_2352 [Acidimicrobiaceae bacterium]|jgi:hypothetical protein
MDHVDGVLVVRGLELRSLLVLTLLGRSSQPVSVWELAEAVGEAGFAFRGRPGKAIADALRWEVARGRVVRADRGMYVAGYVAKVTRHRMRGRVAEMRNQLRAERAASDD